MRSLLPSLLALLLAVPSAPAVARPGRVQGQITVAGRALSGLDIALIDLDTSSVHRTRSAAGGAFDVSLQPGRYALTTEGAPGFSVVRAPTFVSVGSGAITTANLDLALVAAGPLADVPAATGPLKATMDPVSCLLEGQHPLILATIQPVEQVATARVYFKSVLASGFYYVEAVPYVTEDGKTEPGRFVGKLPAPKRQASPLTIFVKASTAAGASIQTPEVSAQVVTSDAECPVAPIGPSGGIQVYSAATNAAVTPVGYAAQGLAVTAGALGLLLSGAAAAGLTATVIVIGPSDPPPPTPPVPSPTPTERPSPRPPSPSPSPSPTPSQPPTPDPGCPRIP
jgi:hypothetical protein